MHQHDPTDLYLISSPVRRVSLLHCSKPGQGKSVKKLRPEVPSMIPAAMVATVAGRVLKACSRTEGGKEPHTIGAEEGERNSPGYQENVKLRNIVVLHGFIGARHGKKSVFDAGSSSPVTHRI